MRALSAIALVGLVALATAQNATYLYIWTGSEMQRRCNDFVVAINVTLDTADFGKITGVEYTPYRGLEPHHAGISNNGKVFVGGAFHSFLNPKLPTLHFFDVGSNPACPRYMKGIRTDAQIPDDFVRIGNQSFLFSLMGGGKAGEPGAIGETDEDLNCKAEHRGPPGDPKAMRGTTFPHGLWSLPAHNKLVSVDLMDYRTTLIGSKGVRKCNTVRIWNLANRTQEKVIPLEGADSLMDVMAIGSTPWVYVTSGNGKIWAVNTVTYESKVILKIARSEDKNMKSHCVFSTSIASGTRLFVTVFGEGRVVLLNTTDILNPTIIQDHGLPMGAGPHALAIAPGNRLLTVTDYYLQQDPRLGTARYPQDRKVRFFRIAADLNSFAPHETVPELDFMTIFKPVCGGARPHGMAYKMV